MALSDRSLVGALGSTAALAVDVLLNSAELVFSLIAFVLTSPEMLVSILMYVDRLAGMVGWLPQSQVENLLVAAIVLLILVLIRRLINDWREST